MPRAFALALLLAVAAASACTVSERSSSDSTGAASAGPAARPVSTGTPVAVLAVQLGAFSDTTNAIRLRDSLSRAGWSAYIRASGGKESPAYRVRVAASRDTTLPRLVAAAFLAAHRDAAVVKDDVRDDSLGNTIVTPVNAGTHGMAASVRWAVAPDRTALLVVEDPVGVEAEPLPNGFVFADERDGVLVQRDSIWDVEPSPDWRRLAIGLAFTTTPRERAAITAAEWAALARETGLSADSVRKAAFPGSGMSAALAVAQPATYDLRVAPVNGARTMVVLPMAGGWRVGWSGNSDALLVGLNPVRAADAEPSPSFVAVDLRGQRLAAGESEAPAPVAWTSGPTLDVSILVDFTSRHTIAAGARSIDSAGGWITTTTGKTVRVVGPGTALVATANGRFVAALVPNAPAKTPGQPARLVVYDLGR